MPYPHLTSPHSELYNRSPHFYCIIRVEYPPTNYPPPTQCCEAHSQSLYQLLVIFTRCPPVHHLNVPQSILNINQSPSPSSTWLYIRDPLIPQCFQSGIWPVSSSHNYSPVCLPHFQRTYSLLYTCSAHFHRIIRVEIPSTTRPSTNLSCETERKSLFESFSVVFPPAHRTSRSYIKIFVPPSQCTIPIQRVISLASPTTMHSQCPFLPHSAPLLNSFMDCSRLVRCWIVGSLLAKIFNKVDNAEEDVLAKKSTVLGTLWRNKTEVPSRLTEARGREVGSSLFCFDGQFTLVSYIQKRMKCVWLMSTMHHDDAVNEDQEGKPDILPSAFLQIKLMKQRKSENADNTKQNNVRDYELVCLTYVASGKVVTFSVYVLSLNTTNEETEK
ncbi:hypothetical protein T02_4322 [Trichinella nativa]|uniref:Uncharacterized protein n=1 Tax=Trichinella nativa TaxID=6335 RepID=A0A0V1KN43_9BILA|nr:hypothetical protein T02_4322 [Trichinella nativa]